MRMEKAINYKFGATDATGPGVKSVEQNLQRLGSLAKTYAPIIAGIFSAAGLAKAIDLFTRQEQAVFQLEQRLKSTGGVAGVSSQQLQSMASALQGVTTYGDEAIIEMEGLLLAFTNIRGEIFEQALPAVLDMSTAMGKDLQSSALQLGKALNDPIKGVAALAEAGIRFSISQREQIKALVETGQVAEAQRLILEKLEVRFGGAAKAARQGLGGSLMGLKNSFSDALEKIGSGGTGFIGSIRELEGLITSPQFQKGLEDIASGIAWVGQMAAKAAAGVGTLVDSLPTDDAQRRVRQIVELKAQLLDEQKELPEGGIAGAFFSVRRDQIATTLAALDAEYTMLVKLAAFNAKPEKKTKGGAGAGGGGGLGNLVQMDQKEWDSILSQQELDDAVSAINNFKAALQVRLDESPPLNLGFSGFDITAHMAGRDNGSDDGSIAIAERFAGLQASMMSEEELIRSSYWNRMSITDQAWQAGLVREAEYDATRLQLKQENEYALTEAHRSAEMERYLISTATDRMRLEAAGQGASQLGMVFEASDKLFKGKIKALFIASQVAAAAGAIIHGHQAAMAAVAPPPIGLGPVFGPPLSAVMLAGGYVNAAAIMAQTFSGSGSKGAASSFGGGTGGYGGGTPNSPIVTQPTGGQAQQAPQEIHIRLVGAVSEAYVENELVPLLNAAHGRNVTMTFAKE